MPKSVVHGRPGVRLHVDTITHFSIVTSLLQSSPKLSHRLAYIQDTARDALIYTPRHAKVKVISCLEPSHRTCRVLGKCHAAAFDCV